MKMFTFTNGISMLCNQYIQIPCDVEGNIYLNGIKIMSSSHNIGNCFTNPTLATITHKHKLAKLSCLKILSLEENIDFSMSISGFNSPFFDLPYNFNHLVAQNQVSVFPKTLTAP